MRTGSDQRSSSVEHSSFVLPLVSETEEPTARESSSNSANHTLLLPSSDGLHLGNRNHWRGSATPLVRQTLLVQLVQTLRPKGIKRSLNDEYVLEEDKSVRDGMSK
ncbi:hypothetical protein BLNAU_24168 [Blattamonas nauphoetae]|uniref:Uncharacterized protein n=1 Tax=Blattamonas nauphoetae TaxID=2049346 RepID=A0ABQ9WNJ0_9EUKA|nr:hypothetical protein BLNAU_24168 [Blattamonas nauphoetae]